MKWTAFELSRLWKPTEKFTNVRYATRILNATQMRKKNANARQCSSIAHARRVAGQTQLLKELSDLSANLIVTRMMMMNLILTANIECWRAEQSNPHNGLESELLYIKGELQAQIYNHQA